MRVPALAKVICIAGLLAVCTFRLAAAPAETNAAGHEFFEKKIRPILADHCYSCHSAKAEKLKGALYLDTRDGWMKGGSSGPALVPGKPDDSRLIKAVRYSDAETAMPPNGKKLAPEQVADLEAWVKLGAPDPRNGGVTNLFAIDWKKARAHWAFQPVASPTTPDVRNKRWVQTPVDAFVLARLEAKGMSPSPRADKRALIRRVTFDLTGLPPQPADIHAFLADSSPDAFAKVVDRLLASPQYGERWGRHWLDVARYADTKGYVGGNEEPRYPFAYTYRDYVIRAFNDDLPFDKFLLHQIAADQLALGDDNRPLAALGFLTVGRRFIGNENDIADDRIDVITRGTMALTVTCARCHDHKYDPVPTKDYYSLFAVFRSSLEPAELPLLKVETPHPEYTNYVAELSRRQAKRDACVASNELVVLRRLRAQVPGYLLTVHESAGLTNNTKLDEFVRGRKLNNAVHRAWKTNLVIWATNGHPIFTPWIEFEKLPEAEFARKAGELAAKFAANDGSRKLNPLVAQSFAGPPPAALTNVAALYGKLFAQVERHWDEAVAQANPYIALNKDELPSPQPTALADAGEEAIRQFWHATNSPVNPPGKDFPNNFLFSDDVKNQIDTLKRQVVALDATHPGAPPRAMAMNDKPKPSTGRVFIRGNPGTPGPEVPRQFLEIVAGEKRSPFPTNASGRLQLAQAIASRDNPLTARVFVNRVWQHHFGAGLVRTPSDFGLRSEPPTHPELLDYLATRFMDEGWSVKKLHRLILLSSTYQQASEDAPQYALRDPDNRLLWKQNRRRLDFEAMRDSLLAVAGKLDPTMGGQASVLETNLAGGRRTVYGFIDRQDLPNLFRTFDFANPDTSTGQRFQTTVPTQALFLLNSPFVTERVKNLVERACFTSLAKDEDRIRELYQALFQRAPTKGELQAGKAFLDATPAEDTVMPEIADWKYGFAGYDEAAQRVTNFIHLTQFTGTSWQAGTNVAEKKIGALKLTPEGGQPAPTNTIAAVRRWIAPRDGQITIEAELGNPGKQGDGVRGRIVSSRTGLLGEWTVTTNAVATSVKRCDVSKGDRIDFVVDCRADATADNFKWAPLVSMVDAASKANMATMALPMSWDARQNFVDPKKLPRPLGAWEKYAQVLLLANEFAFVD